MVGWFVITGVSNIILEKHCSIKILRVCLLVGVASLVMSVVAVIIYAVDLGKNVEVPCRETYHGTCDTKHYDVKLSRGVKSSLLLFTLAQAVVSSVLIFFLFRERRSFAQYDSLTASPPVTPTSATPPDLN
ncbi:hypothetical protein LDENG_00195860 [Lucifuga dentata]|nr:hypothetical protein LDENG_00195860 [Lucifuga dentata]